MSLDENSILADSQLQQFVEAETQRQRFQVNIIHVAWLKKIIKMWR